MIITNLFLTKLNKFIILKLIIVLYGELNHSRKTNMMKKLSLKILRNLEFHLMISILLLLFQKKTIFG